METDRICWSAFFSFLMFAHLQFSFLYLFDDLHFLGDNRLPQRQHLIRFKHRKSKQSQSSGPLSLHSSQFICNHQFIFFNKFITIFFVFKIARMQIPIEFFINFDIAPI